MINRYGLLKHYYANACAHGNLEDLSVIRTRLRYDNLRTRSKSIKYESI